MTQASGEYSPEFYRKGNDAGKLSAETVVPYLMQLLQPDSIVDVGCGEGVWLAAFARAGVRRKLGIDGAYVQQDRLRIPPTEFMARDLAHQPFTVDQRFALVVSLEVAEHLPASSAAGFVESLVGLGPCVLFSAAVPFQGGTHHVNLQWPDYWARLFAAHGYVPVDAIRPKFWDDERVAFFYRQNTLLYIEASKLSALPELLRLREATAHLPLAIGHPQFIAYLATGLSDEQLRGLYLGQVVRRLPGMVAQSVRHRLGMDDRQ